MATSGSELEEFLGQFQALASERLKKISTFVVELEETQGEADSMVELARELHTLKGEARLLELAPIARMAHGMEDVLEVAKSAAGNDAWDLVLQGADLCLELVRRAPDFGEAESEVVSFEQSVEQLKAGSASLPPALNHPETQDLTLEAPRMVETPSARSDKADGYEFVRILLRDVERILGIASPLRTSGQMLERELRSLAAQADLLPAHRAALRRCLERISTLLDHANELDGELRTLRMAPLSHLTDDVRRIVRETARAEGKLARVDVSGAGVSLDRMVLAALREALTHLASNAVAHGIEAPRLRAQRGKPEEGRITLEAVQRGGRALLTFTDDGQGIDPDALKRAAVKSGTITDEQAETLTIEETLRLIFMPGVSTSARVGQVAGRGVGLDVVLRRIEEVRGTIEAETFVGQGTVFRIDVPVSIATAHLTVMRAGNLRFALPAWSVLSIEMVASDLEWINKDEAVIPLLKPPSVGATEEDARALDAKQPAVLLRTAHGVVGLMVDQVMGGAESAIVGAPPRLIADHPLLSAVADIGAGEIVPVLDPSELTLAATRGTAPSSEVSKPARRIVVADDSPITLAVIVDILEGLGYDTIGVHDGLEALAEVRRRPPDLLLTDVEMPRMNGFELLARVRAEPETKEMPVVVLTAKGSDDDRKKGVELGADAYLLKGDFKQERLVGLIHNLIHDGAKS
jgi:chemotaxis protein histidine kinase CheA